jgi:hypothetical protein
MSTRRPAVIIHFKGFNMLLKKIAAAAVIAAGAMGAAVASPINATGAVGVLGISSVPAGAIGLGTTFSFQFSLFSGGTGDLSIVPIGNFLTTSSMTATNGSAVSFDAVWGDFSGTVTGATLSVNGNQRVVEIRALGMFTPQSGPPDLSGFDPGMMSLTFSATQTGSGPNPSVSASYSIASPPNGVPEPMSMALVGLGLMAAAGLSRRKVAA